MSATCIHSSSSKPAEDVVILHRILIVGTGSIGTRHVRCMRNTGRATVGICEPNGDLRKSVSSTYAIDETYENLDQALAARWDAAVIATPAPSHVSVAQRLTDGGVGVLIEKPLAVAEDGVARLAATIGRKGLPAGVAYVYRAHPAAAAMRQALHSGRFGTPLHLVVVSGQPFWHLRPAYRDIYYAHRAQGGGGIQDGLTHSFNLCEWLVGPITRIAVDAAHLRLDGVSVEDTVNALARHDGSVLASYAFNQHQAPNDSTITVVCTDGTLRLETRRNRWMWMTEPCGAWQEQTFELPNQDDWFVRQEHAFLDHVEGKGPALCSLSEGWQTLRVNVAALSSTDDGGAWRVVAPVEKTSAEIGVRQADVARVC